MRKLVLPAVFEILLEPARSGWFPPLRDSLYDIWRRSTRLYQRSEDYVVRSWFIEFEWDLYECKHDTREIITD